ncbi:CrcB family protein [Streptomyces sp. NPDC047097]|uniref:fluoride efflux transporter FluC n=1 Tax=Streptomyces sp. NPDC047097 TaxID=3155260 RepID=UPI0033E361D5
MPDETPDIPPSRTGSVDPVDPPPPEAPSRPGGATALTDPRDPVDPDTGSGPRSAAPRTGGRREEVATLAVIAVGGALGACARYGATLLWPTEPGAFPWTTFAVNVTGCAAMGVLMGLLTVRTATHRLVRPFLGTGMLGGYTTFSTYTVEGNHLLGGDPGPGLGLLYLAATPAAALLAVWGAAVLTRRAATPRPHRLRGRA